MKALIKTPRLLMRKFCLEDVDAVFEFSSNADVTLYTGDADSVKTRNDALKIITDIWLPEYKKYGYGRYALVHRESGLVIGFCGLKYIPEHERADLGYRMLPEYWGQGLGFEAAAAALEYGRRTLGLKSIFAEADADNVASNRILERIGLKLTRQHDEYGFKANFFEDVENTA